MLRFLDQDIAQFDRLSRLDGELFADLRTDCVPHRGVIGKAISRAWDQDGEQYATVRIRCKQVLVVDRINLVQLGLIGGKQASLLIRKSVGARRE